MRKLIFTFLVFSFAITNYYSQDLKKTLINDNLDELFINKDNPFGSIPIKTVEKYFSESSKLYFFEIVYNGKVIFREGVKKSIPQSRDSETMSNQFRFNYDSIYLNASEISDSDKIKLLESYKNRIVDISGQKLLYLGDYQIVKKDINKNKFVIVNPLENMQIKIYKIESL
ncbi:hypothetical protein G6R40_02365 [Chryseobacterium sp. POL2]|uniref:hypothetical protein n=1 Tax=Chryseobacterium sp. POL2 TaxID=2713414 RepID=UPI0013E10136|nr:hypothetical protein [Chryseobacterium sp. POL2]QIG88575.1 hypothetical protein G6R40_02365 [Chryseobacterium sp. POL2]